MSNGGKRLRELLMQERFDISDVALAIGVGRSTIYTWTTTAPIDKLYAIAKYTKISFDRIADCYNPDRDELIPADRTGGENN
jgi:transcriptional regulator with XRE-family HTH domain